MKILIIGHAGHGKDTLAAILKFHFGLNYKGSSQAAAEIFIYDKLRNKYGYSTPDECFRDRINHRAEWYDLILEYNSLDRARLAKDIMSSNDIYVGMRSDEEIKECLRQQLFQIILGIYNPRLPLEPSDSFDIDLWAESDIVIPNTGTIDQLRDRAMKLHFLKKNVNITTNAKTTEELLPRADHRM